MLFNSIQFIFFFLPIVLLVYYSLNYLYLSRFAKLWLVSASLYFYSYWELSYLPLIVLSLVFNFFSGIYINRLRTSPLSFSTAKRLMQIGVFVNLLVLGYFKYSYFLVESANQLVGTNIDFEKLILPLAISFFTFQQVSYLIDCYKGEGKDYDFISYSLFVVFFPQLIAGPIVHHKEVIPQFKVKGSKKIQPKNILLGGGFFSIGLFKKVVVADQFAIWADQGFSSVANLHFIDA